MSEYVNAELHETAETIEVRWEYNGRVYGLVMSQEMFDRLDISKGEKTPVLRKIAVGIDSPKWQHGIDITDEGVSWR